mmetsp:Transcript_20988/g.34670  ORF Transcript_20988/g.34670 Transcript_20988/m.34670 type:complete len:542 (+) Transcript_20988:77-1702(+)|eukprot:CAMPEP_0119328328 /NCGR_PEP_ID=MMETSP1333-20130426/73049_1 /TAXON_ID=418940 /ORGANISM="Scyphosphaera apsteinii, Strain RCC1455" /LENGTH=541 /DNA_ID=CAMNT_0007337143 /DNA_START=70 /DNA_END=1695 /DNA_ORIENTATION=+
MQLLVQLELVALLVRPGIVSLPCLLRHHAPPVMLATPPMFSVTSSPNSMVELCANGKVNRFQSNLTRIRTCKLSSRDVRLLRSSTPVLAVREGFILFDFGDLKGVLQHDRLTLIGADRAAVNALGSQVQQQLALSRGDLEEYPFEVRALECVLEQSYSLLEQSQRRLSSLVTSTLAEMTDTSSRQTDARRGLALARLLPMQISLKALETKATRLTEIIKELLENEDDIADMCLSLLHRRSHGSEVFSSTRASTSSNSGGAVSPLPIASGASNGHSTNMMPTFEADIDTTGLAMLGDGSIAAAATRALDKDAGAERVAIEEEEAEAERELIETLLDVYLARLEALKDQIESITAEIETTQIVLELTLDNERNRIARLELLLSMIGLGVGFSAAVSGFFGMNLLSGVEMVPGLFGFVIGISVFISSGLMATWWCRFRSVSRDQRSRLNDVQALKHVLAKMDVVALLLRNRPPLPAHSNAMQAELRALLMDSGLPAMSTRELALLCNILKHEQPSASELSRHLYSSLPITFPPRPEINASPAGL